MVQKRMVVETIRWAIARLNEGEHRAYSELVSRLGTTRSRLLRKLIREAILQGPDLLARELDAVIDAGAQVAAIGRNLNQIARHLNSGRVKDAEEVRGTLEAAKGAVERVGSTVDEVVYRTKHRWVRRGR